MPYAVHPTMLTIRRFSAGRDARNAPSGIEVEVATTDPDTTDLIGTAGSGTPDQYYFFACVRAEPGATAENAPGTANDHGPWAISSGAPFSRNLNTPRGVSSSRTTGDSTFNATLSWNAVSGATGYEVASRTRTRTRTRTRDNANAAWGRYGAWGDWVGDWTVTDGGWTTVGGCTTSGCTAVTGASYDDVTDPANTTTQTETDVETQVRVRATVTVGASAVMSLWAETEVSHAKP